MSSEFIKATFRLLFATVLVATLLMFAATIASAQETSSTQNANAQVASGTSAAAIPSNTNAAMPVLAPVYTNYRGVTIGMSAAEVRDKLDHLRNKGKKQDDFDFSNGESAQIYYDGKGNVQAMSINYFGKKSNAPTPQAVIGEEVQTKPNGSTYKLVRYPQAGYWIAYSRTAGDAPLVTVTMQKMRTQKKIK